ncbi:MAG: AMP-binding protein, partial [Blastococcus sp.]|nr:AMP-binding protein [Blastococcus sp.]
TSTRAASGADDASPTESHGGSWHDLDALVAATPADGGDLPAEPTRREDPLLTYFTSGTVSHPKMVTHAQEYGLAHVPTARFWHDLRPGDRHWTVTDTGWAKAAWGGLFGQLHERATIVQVALGRPTADTILRIIAEHRVTSFCAPPTLYRTLVQADLGAYDLSALRHCTSAGEPLNPEVIRVWARGTGGLTVYDAYGQTETSVLVANYRALPVRPGSMGLPVPGWDVEVLGEDRRRAPDGVVGDIAVRTDGERRPVGLFRGYDGNPEATAERFRDGWYFTGDKAARDADGYLWFEGRDDDVITSSAYRIGPFEVESALVEHPAVMEAAVVGKPDRERTEIVTAFVILAPGSEASDDLARELQDHVKSVTAPYKYPREIHFVSELPKTISGKIRRTELRARLRSEA